MALIPRYRTFITAVALVAALPQLAFGDFLLRRIDVRRLNTPLKVRVLGELRNFSRAIETSRRDGIQTAGARREFEPFELAHADEAYECLYGGWPSVYIYKDGRRYCKWPQAGNSSYAELNQGTCSESQLLCNPAMFGPGLCVGFSALEERKRPFAACEKKFAEAGRSYDEIFASADTRQFQELASTVSRTCSEGSSYGRANPEVCGPLNDRMGLYILDNVLDSQKSADAALKSDDSEALSGALDELIAELESIHPKFLESCSKDPIPDELSVYCRGVAEKIQGGEKLMERLVSRLETLAEDHECRDEPPFDDVETLASNTDSVLQCTKEDIATASNDCRRDWACAVGSSALTIFSFLGDAYNYAYQPKKSCIASQNSCMLQMVKGVVDSLWSLATGLWDIATWAGSWAWSSIAPIEDKTSDALLTAGQMTDEDVVSFTEDPIQWTTDFLTGLWTAFVDYAKTSLYCEEWSGVPKVSTCTRPWRGWDCMECSTMMAGTCAAIGVAAAEIIPTFMTGGAWAGGKWAAKGGGWVAKGAFAVAKNSPRVMKAYDKLGDGVKAFRASRAGTVATRLGSGGVRITHELASRGRKAVSALKSTGAYQSAVVLADKILSSPWTLPARVIARGVKEVNVAAFNAGYKSVDDAIGSAVQRADGGGARALVPVADDAVRVAAEVPKIEMPPPPPPAIAPPQLLPEGSPITTRTADGKILRGRIVERTDGSIIYVEESTGEMYFVPRAEIAPDNVRPVSGKPREVAPSGFKVGTDVELAIEGGGKVKGRLVTETDAFFVLESPSEPGIYFKVEKSDLAGGAGKVSPSRYSTDAHALDIRSGAESVWDEPIEPRALSRSQPKWKAAEQEWERLQTAEMSLDPDDPRARKFAEGRKWVRDEGAQISDTVNGQHAQKQRITAAEARAARENYLDAQDRVDDWLMDGEDLSIEKIQELNRIYSRGLENNGVPPGQLRGKGQDVAGVVPSRSYFVGGDVAPAMEDFMAWYRKSEQAGMPPVELAARSYQRLVTIHPFGDANGRTARAVMNWVLRRNGFPPATLAEVDKNVAIYGLQIRAGRTADVVTPSDAVEQVTRGIERTIDLMKKATD